MSRGDLVRAGAARVLEVAADGDLGGGEKRERQVSFLDLVSMSEGVRGGL